MKVLSIILILLSLCACTKTDPEVEAKLDKIKFAYTDIHVRDDSIRYQDINDIELNDDNKELIHSWITFSCDTEALDLWENGVFIKYGIIDDHHAFVIGYYDLTDTSIIFHYHYDNKIYQEEYEYSFKHNERNPLRPILCLKDGDTITEFNSLPNYTHEEELERMAEGL